MEFPPRPVPQTPVGLTDLTLGVEESRAKRHQRQQSRFRDRGGIFKPSNRNTLVDILMGRRAASPKKSMRRSTSRSPSKRAKTPSMPELNDSTVSLTKTPRKTRPPKASVEGNRTVHLNKSELQESSAAQPATKGRGRPPKHSVPTGDATKQVKSGPKSKSKTSKSGSTPRRKRSGSQKSKASSAAVKSSLDAVTTSAQPQVKSSSTLPTIAEETERSEISDDDGSMVANTNEVKRKGKRRLDAATAEMSKRIHMADIGVEDAAVVRERKKGTRASGSRTEIRPKKKPLSKKSMATVPAASQELNHPDPPKSAKHQAKESDSRPKIVATDGDEATTHSVKLMGVNGIPVKEGGPTKLATRRKRQKTGPYADDVKVENQGSGATRVRSCMTGMEDGEMSKASKQGENLANGSALKCRDVDPIAQIPTTSKKSSQAKQGSSITSVSLEMRGAKSTKRIRDPEDSSLTLSPSKRFKPDDADTGPGADKNLCARSGKGKPAKQVDRFEVVDKRIPPSRKLKENTTSSKKPSKPSTQGNKSKISNKRAKGLPRRVLQRLKNSDPHPVDDEPDPIDFLS